MGTRRLRVGVVDLTSNKPLNTLWSRVMQANFASIMPQVIAVWCEEAGHDVRFVCYTGVEKISDVVPDDLDVLFIGAFTQAAHAASAMSHRARQSGAVTVLGGPHARCYPEDAARHFDYVLGFTDKPLVMEVLRDCSPHRPEGLVLSAKKQPAHLPGVRERWKFIEPTLAKAPVVKLVPMIGSLGCPYTCSFCIDSTVDYAPLAHDQIQEDLRFLARRVARPRIGWHDPNFGVRFDETMAAIEEAVPPGGLEFVAESSLSLLTEPHLERLRKNGCVAILPGIESWYSLGNKSKTGSRQGAEKVEQVSDHVNTILRYIPYVQTNFVLGLDDGGGAEPFELTKLFVDKTPGAFPGYSLLSAFGRAAPLNLDLQREGRVLPFPFHFLDNNKAMNVRPRNYTWTEMYDRVVDLTEHTFSPRMIGRRLAANRGALTRSFNFVRAVSSEGFGRIRYHRTIRGLLDSDRGMRRFFEGESAEIPAFYTDRVRRELGALWDWLPAGSLTHDPNAYLRDAARTSGGQAAVLRAASPSAAGRASAAPAGEA
jgi:hypothetical protein